MTVAGFALLVGVFFASMLATAGAMFVAWMFGDVDPGTNTPRDRVRRVDRRRLGEWPMSERQNAAVCGSDSGYHKHRRLGEETCVACRKAHRLAANVANLAAGRALQVVRHAYPEAYNAAYIRELWKIRGVA